MDKFSKTVLFSYFFIICLSASSSSAQQQCSNYTFPNNNLYTTCLSLPVLNSFLHYTSHQSNGTVDVAFRQTGMSANNWISWGLNLGSRRMLQAQCLVAFHDPTGRFFAYTSAIRNNYNTRLPQGSLSFPVPRIAGEFRNGNEMIIYATIQLPSGRTSFTHVWQLGVVRGDYPGEHSLRSENRRSFETIDFATNGTTSGTSSTSGSSRGRDRNVHGLLNVVSWGIMLPLGAISARYLKVFKAGNPAWFYLHVTCQTLAYIVGIAGWATGLRLGNESEGVDQDTHGTIGATLFGLGTLQVFALLLRPKPDHKYRFYWNLYHHGVGYTVIILSIINIFEGLEILDPEQKWRTAYVGVLVFLGSCILVLEPFTWYIVLKRKTDSRNKHQEHYAIEINGDDAT